MSVKLCVNVALLLGSIVSVVFASEFVSEQKDDSVLAAGQRDSTSFMPPPSSVGFSGEYSYAQPATTLRTSGSEDTAPASYFLDRGTANQMLRHACTCESVSVCAEFVKLGADIHADFGIEGSLLHIACNHGNAAVIEWLITAGLSVTATTPNGLTPLHSACRNGYFFAVDTLLKAGADPYARTSQGSTTLNLAAKYGHLDVVNRLIPLNVDIEARNTYGNTPLLAACEHGHLSVVKALLTARANPNVASNLTTPIWFACRNNDTEMAIRLIAASANVEVKGPDGASPMELAVRNGNQKLLHALMKAVTEKNADTFGIIGSPLVDEIISANSLMFKESLDFIARNPHK